MVLRAWAPLESWLTGPFLTLDLFKEQGFCFAFSPFVFLSNTEDGAQGPLSNTSKPLRVF